jgi:ADP-L-glycero-D-manno-heptose 6-epimerase
MTLHFYEHRDKNGLFNVGTGNAQTWVELVTALFDAVGKPVNIEFVDMPENIREKYQYFTEADLTKIRNAGYDKNIMNVHDGVSDYVKNYLLKDVYLGMSK